MAWAGLGRPLGAQQLESLNPVRKVLGNQGLGLGIRDQLSAIRYRLASRRY